MGCGVAWQDVRQGRNEIIEDGEKGQLVEGKNINELGEYMSEIMEDGLRNVKNNEKVYY